MTIHAPLPDYAAAKAAMVDSQLRPEGVTDPAVIAAMTAVPRHQFVADDARALAYSDRSVSVGAGRSIAAPGALGGLLMALAPVAGERALVVGAGSGYSAAVLSAMGLTVTALETAPDLAARARANGVKVTEGALEDGHSKGAPYDLILIDGAVEYIPPAIVAQLGEGGRLGTALVDRGITRLIVGRSASGAFGHLAIGDAGVPPLPGFTRPRTFQF